MRRSVAAYRRRIESPPQVASLESVRIGERNLINDEPIIVTRVEVEGPVCSLEGWHAETGELLAWRWSAEEEERRLGRISD